MFNNWGNWEYTRWNHFFCIIKAESKRNGKRGNKEKKNTKLWGGMSWFIWSNKNRNAIEISS